MPKASLRQTPPAALIEAFRTSPTGVFQQAEIVGLLVEHRWNWDLARHASTDTLLASLIQNTDLQQVTLHSDLRGRPTIRYTWGTVSPYRIAQSLTRTGYMSHATAVELHRLSEGHSAVIYVNQEQTPKPRPSGALVQEAVDRAFAKRQRTSRNVFRWEGGQIVILNGKNTGRLGVADVRVAAGMIVPMTNLERTLIDIAVRPEYAGGPGQVLKAYRNAKDRFDIDALARTLTALSYIYPYHQVVGFYLTRAGVDPSSLSKLRDMGLNFDFYLAYGMVDSAFDAEWRVHVPKDLI